MFGIFKEHLIGFAARHGSNERFSYLWNYRTGTESDDTALFYDKNLICICLKLCDGSLSCEK